MNDFIERIITSHDKELQRRYEANEKFIVFLFDDLLYQSYLDSGDGEEFADF